jgi:hypothetical protein
MGRYPPVINAAANVAQALRPGEQLAHIRAALNSSKVTPAKLLSVLFPTEDG